MPYIPYTDEQKQLANSVDLPTFLQMRGETLVPVGREYKLIYYDSSGKHDSITVSGSQWFDHKNQVGGGTIKLMREHFGMSFQEAMNALLGHSTLPLSHEAQPIMAKEKREFRLPQENTNMHRVYAYLIKQRCISPEIITHFAKTHQLYEDAQHHNAVFVGMNESGVPMQAHLRSTSTFGNGFRQTLEGSDTDYSFAHFGESDTLYLFEAPIDMLSFLTLYPQEWHQHSYLAMNGVYESAVIKALETHPNLQVVVICTDNDEGGIDANDRLSDILKEKGYTGISRLLPEQKDWNEMLKKQNGLPYQKAVPHKRLLEYRRQMEDLSCYPCRADKLRLQIRAAYQNGQYKYLAEYALAGSAFFMQKSGKSVDYDKLKYSLRVKYRPYRDRCKTTVLCRRLSDKIADVLQDLTSYARTKEQSVATAKKLYELADCAVRVSVGQVMEQPAQSQDETISEEPEPVLQFG